MLVPDKRSSADKLWKAIQDQWNASPQDVIDGCIYALNAGVCNL